MQQCGPTFPSVPSHGCDPTSRSTPQSTQVLIHPLKPSQTYLKFSALLSSRKSTVGARHGVPMPQECVPRVPFQPDPSTARIKTRLNRWWALEIGFSQDELERYELHRLWR
jgi:hypothetical protein